MMDTMKAKFPVFMMPICIIAIVYFVDSALFWISGSAKPVADEAASESSNNLIEIAAIVLCVVLPAIYFNLKPNSGKQESTVPTAEDASARLRLKVTKSPTNVAADGASTKTRPLSEMLRAEDAAGQRAPFFQASCKSGPLEPGYQQCSESR